MQPMEAHVIGEVSDLEQRGFDVVLDLLQNHVGANGLTVPIDPPPSLQFRALTDAGPALVRAPGGLWFRTRPDRYARTRLKPLHAPRMRGRDPFGALAERCANRGFALRAWLNGCRNPLAAAGHPDMVVRNALDLSSDVWLCPSHPDVRAYLFALVDDLGTACALDAVVLGSPLWLPPAEALPDVRAAVPLGPAERFLAALCFCESCRQRAAEDDVEVRSLATLVRSRLSQPFRDEPTAVHALDELLESHPALARFDVWRRAQAETLVHSLAEQARVPLVVLQRADGRFQQTALPRLMLECEGPGMVDACVRRAADSGIPAGRLELLFQLRPGALADAPSLVTAATRAAECGLRSVSLANLALWPAKCLDWLRQALRHARRTQTIL